MSVKSFREKYIRTNPPGTFCELRIGRAILLFSAKMFDSQDKGRGEIRQIIGDIKERVTDGKIKEALQELERED